MFVTTHPLLRLRKTPKTGCETEWSRLYHNKMWSWRSVTLLHLLRPVELRLHPVLNIYYCSIHNGKATPSHLFYKKEDEEEATCSRGGTKRQLLKKADKKLTWWRWCFWHIPHIPSTTFTPYYPTATTSMVPPHSTHVHCYHHNKNHNKTHFCFTSSRAQHSIAVGTVAFAKCKKWINEGQLSRRVKNRAITAQDVRKLRTSLPRKRVAENLQQNLQQNQQQQRLQQTIKPTTTTTIYFFTHYAVVKTRVSSSAISRKSNTKPTTKNQTEQIQKQMRQRWKNEQNNEKKTKSYKPNMNKKQTKTTNFRNNRKPSRKTNNCNHRINFVFNGAATVAYFSLLIVYLSRVTPCRRCRRSSQRWFHSVSPKHSRT